MSNVPSIRLHSAQGTGERLIRPMAAPAPARPALTALRRDQLQVSGARAGVAATPLRPFTMNVGTFNQHLDQVTDSRLTHGNSVEFFVDGREAYPRIIETIRGAQRSLHMEMYIFKDDQTSWNVAEALAERAQSGVNVRLVCDWLGSPVSSRIFDFLRANGVEVRHHTPAAGNDQITHRKMIIADGQRAMTGGMNIADEYEHSWHDTMIRIQGPAVGDMQRHFLDSWRTTGGSAVTENADIFPPAPATPPGSSDLRVLTTYPAEDIRVSLFAAIDSARSHVNIETPYFSDDQLVDRLVAAARRGVTVNLVVPGINDLPIMDVAARHHYQRMLDAGVNVYQYQGRTMHTKAASVDGVWASIGSANSDNRSLRLHRELNVAISDPATVATIDRNLFARDFQQARRLNGAPQTASQWVATQVVRLFNDQL